jgi:NTP pyrophosphatase (non-canonical NTP hydrolase)
MKNLTEAREAIISDIIAERDRQDQKWGRQAGFWDDHDMVKLTVVTEEVGEIAQAILKADPENLHEEIIQTMAVLMAWAETIEMKVPSAQVIIDSDKPLEAQIEELQVMMSILGGQLKEKIAQKKAICQHIFISHHWSHSDGWDPGYEYGIDYRCELCGKGIESKSQSMTNDIELTDRTSKSILLKIKNNKVIVFDPIIKSLKERSEYDNKKINDLIVPGLRIRLEDFGVWDSEVRIDKDEK